MLGRDTTPAKPRSAQTLLRGLNLLEELASLPGPASVGELAMRLGLTKPTASRLLAALRDAQYVTQDAKTRRYRLTGKMFSLAESFASRSDIRDVARPHLQTLGEETGETVHLGILDGKNVMYIDKLESTQSIRIGSAIGQVMPVSTTALGKAICSAMERADYEQFVGQLELVYRTPKSLTDTWKFDEEIEKARQRGYAIDNQENEPGITCIASPVLGPHGVIGAISLSGPSERMYQHLEYIARKVRGNATEVSNQMGAMQCHLPSD